MLTVGVDFGTCNSTCSVLLPNGEIRSISLEEGRKNEFTLPSWWYYAEGGGKPVVGSAARDAYIDNSYSGRFITSVKTHLRDLTLRSTRISGKSVTLEEIVAELLRTIRSAVEKNFGQIGRVYAGRPVHLGDSTEDDQRVELRIARAFELAGFPKPTFILEPVAAAYAYKRSIETSRIALIADFGGGTLDYSVAYLQPIKSRHEDEILGVSGVRIGGEDLTSATMRLFWKDFGYECEILDFTRTKYHPMPHRFFAELSQWTNLWKFQAFREEIFRFIGWGSTDPGGLERLAALLEEDCYYDFLARMEELKFALTDAETVPFEYRDGPIDIRREITRRAFEHHAAKYMDRAKRVLQEALDNGRVDPEDIEVVFLTGGSSQVPAFRKMIETVFDSSIVQSGDFFTSVSAGLAAYGAIR
jgi:hypothetical chaperone protein